MFSHHHICMQNGISIKSIFKSYCKIQKHCFSSCNASENFSTGTAAQERARRIPCSLSSADKKAKPFSSCSVQNFLQISCSENFQKAYKSGLPGRNFCLFYKNPFRFTAQNFCFRQIVFPGFTNLTFQMTIPDKLTQCDLFRFGCRLIIKNLCVSDIFPEDPAEAP